MQHGKLPGYNSIGRRASPGKFPGIPLKGFNHSVDISKCDCSVAPSYDNIALDNMKFQT